jgi:hypothetical protein
VWERNATRDHEEDTGDDDASEFCRVPALLFGVSDKIENIVNLDKKVCA